MAEDGLTLGIALFTLIIVVVAFVGLWIKRRKLAMKFFGERKRNWKGRKMLEEIGVNGLVESIEWFPNGSVIKIRLKENPFAINETVLLSATRETEKPEAVK